MVGYIVLLVLFFKAFEIAQFVWNIRDSKCRIWCCKELLR